MLTTFVRTVCAIALLTAASGPALADLKMPKNLRPLPSRAVNDIYSSKSVVFSDFRYYYSKDGKVVGFSEKPLSFAEGRWTTNKNRACVDVVWKGAKNTPPFSFNACYDWFTDGQAYWTQISASSDGSLVGQVFQGNPGLVRDQDVVSRRVTTAKQQLGY